MKRLVCTMVLLGGVLVTSSQANPISISAVADARVKLGSDTEYGSDSTAVVGRDSGSVVNRLYVKFSLPALDPGCEYASASLHGFYYWDTWDGTDREFSWYRVDDDTWGETTITGNNAPAYGGDAIATWTPTGTSYGASGHAYNEWQSWDILSTLAAETDGSLTLVLKQTDEALTGGLESFYTKEKTPLGQYAFHIDYTTRQTQTPTVPVPATLGLAGLGLSCLLRLKRRFSI